MNAPTQFYVRSAAAGRLASPGRAGIVCRSAPAATEGLVEDTEDQDKEPIIRSALQEREARLQSILETAPDAAPVPQPSGSPTNAPLRLTPELVTQFAEEMATNHPALLAARARTNAAAANVKSIRTWEDPMARIGAMSPRRSRRMSNATVMTRA